MPLTIKRTNTTSIAAYSVLFNGSNQYLNTPSDSNFTFGTGSFTMEFWCNYTLSSAQNLFARRFLSQGDNSSTRFQIWIADTSYTINSITTVTGGIVLAHNDPSVQLIGSVGAYNDGNWHHVAFTRNGGTLYCFVDGVLKQSVSNSTNFSAIDSVYIAGRPDGANFAGYMSNVRVINGTALYTASFTAPTSPLTAIANTSLLTCNAPTIVDSSTNNFTITNNGSATVSSINPFRVPINNFQFVRRTPTVFGKSVQFDGTNDYLSLADSANLRIGTSAFCIEAWIYLNTLPGKSIIFGKRAYNTTGTGTYLFRVDSAGNLMLQELQNVTTIVNASAAIQINTWYHVAVSRDASNTVRLFINGSIVSTATSTFNFSSTEPLWIGKDNAAVQLLLNGYISNLRFVNGTAVYTSSFTVPTSPLTAIANTALLTCNADTIFDSSNNNFTITNNNSATVSSVSPFVASSGGMSLKKVYADPQNFTISPAYSGKSTWDLTADGPLILSGSGAWTITPVSNFNTTVKMWGAGGARGYSYRDSITSTNGQGAGGAGGYSTANIAIQTGNSYIIQVGQGGIRTSTPSSGATYLAGGVQGSYGGTQGGGYSGIFITSVSQANALLMAGGGGGGSQDSFSSNAGAGGGNSGQNSPAGSNQGGNGGSQSAGGGAAAYNGPTAGSALTGGLGKSGAGEASLGGGGGGYWGGGGGNVGGGGGGSGRIGTNASVTSGVTTAGAADVPGNSSDASRNGAGRGGNATSNSGADGVVIITKL